MPAAGVPDTTEQPAAHLTWDQVLAWRLRRHHLDQRAPRDAMLDVASAICGLHAQLMSSAEQTLWARVEDMQPGVVERALWEERTLVKTWAVRGTLHLLPAADYPVWQAALSTYDHYYKASWLRHFGFTRQELATTMDAISQALDGAVLTREELADAVAQLTGSDDIRRKLLDSWGATLKPAAFQGRLCYAPGEGQNVRYARPDSWLGDWEPVDPDAAVQELTRRYLSAFGPASRGDYARWGGLTAAQAGRRIDALEEEVVQVDVDGERLWLLAEHVADAAAARPQGVVRLLPRFDQYVIGAPRDEPAILADDFKDRIYRTSGWISAVLLVDGRIEGVWEYEQAGDQLTVEIEAFAPVPAWVREAAEEEAERLAAYSGGELVVGWEE